METMVSDNPTTPMGEPPEDQSWTPPPAPPGYPPPGYPPQGYQQPGYQQPGYPPVYGPGYGAPIRTEPLAIWALVVSILGLLICPIIGSIVALVLAGSASKNIQASGGTLQGAGLALAARIVSAITLALATVFIIVAILAREGR